MLCQIVNLLQEYIQVFSNYLYTILPKQRQIEVIPEHNGLRGDGKTKILTKKGAMSLFLGPEPACGIGFTTPNSHKLLVRNNSKKDGKGFMTKCMITIGWGVQPNSC